MEFVLYQTYGDILSQAILSVKLLANNASPCERMAQMLHTLLDFVLHMDKHLNEWAAAFGPGVYGLFFIIVFCETGLVITPFLPGDSLLFALGALSSGDNASLSYGLLVATLIPAALMGDITNYSIGRLIGVRASREPYSRWIKPSYLERTEEFYRDHGGRTIIMARFIPIIRTFAPFVAGIAQMRYSRFIGNSVLGAFLWVPTFLWAGHWFGNLPSVKSNFHFVIFGIIFITCLPVIFEWNKARQAKN